MRSSLAIRYLASALLTLSLASLSSSHHSHPEAGTHQAELENSPSHVQFERFHEHHDLRDLNDFDEPENHTRLEKRGAMRVSYRTDSEKRRSESRISRPINLRRLCLQQLGSSRPQHLRDLFPPLSTSPRSSKLRTPFCAWPKPGGITDMPGNLQAFRPTDLSEIVLIRERGLPPTLAQSFNVAPRALDPKSPSTTSDGRYCEIGGFSPTTPPTAARSVRK